jgi:uncharacterized protein
MRGRLAHSQAHLAVPGEARLHPERHRATARQVRSDLGRAVLVDLQTAIVTRGQVRLTVSETPAHAWTLSLRVPGWSQATLLRVNGQPVNATADARGYARIERVWTAGDVVELELSMTPHLVEAHPWVEATRGCAAIERGPLVYCLEQLDQSAPIYDLQIDTGAPLETVWQPDLLEGVQVVKTSGYAIDRAEWEGRLYRPLQPNGSQARTPVTLTAIPHYAWANRGPNAMKVWVPRA